MPEAITNTSPMLYLYRIGVLEWLPHRCDDIWVPQAVVDELHDSQSKGYDVPSAGAYDWLQIVEPQAVPSAWLARDFGAGELAVLASALDHPLKDFCPAVRGDFWPRPGRRGPEHVNSGRRAWCDAIS
jgi:predicted nucleic acid-binding protein